MFSLSAVAVLLTVSFVCDPYNHNTFLSGLSQIFIQPKHGLQGTKLLARKVDVHWNSVQYFCVKQPTVGNDAGLFYTKNTQLPFGCKYYFY
ncbi:MAG: hypothetical protein COB50_02540 [Thiotrichales bacterium]|nr:MAG: hypothetical protein COB50_02540 [Thiotrichales bacterium]